MRSNQSILSRQQNQSINRWVKQPVTATRVVAHSVADTPVDPVRADPEDVQPIIEDDHQYVETIRSRIPQQALSTREYRQAVDDCGCGNKPSHLQSNTNGFQGNSSCCNNNGCCNNNCCNSCYDDCDRKSDGHTVSPGQDALVSAARMTLQDVADSYKPSLKFDDPITDVNQLVLTGSDILGATGRGLRWYAPDSSSAYPSFVAANEISSVGFGLLPLENVDIPLWSYYEVQPNGLIPGQSTPSGNNLVLKQSGPFKEGINRIFPGYPAGQEVSTAYPFFKHKIIAITRAVPSLDNLSKQYLAIELYRSDTGALTDRLIIAGSLNGVSAVPNVNPTNPLPQPQLDSIILDLGLQGVGPVSNDDRWLVYSYELGTVTTTPATATSVASYQSNVTQAVTGFLHVNPITGKFLQVDGTALPAVLTATNSPIQRSYQFLFDDKSATISAGPYLINLLPFTESAPGKDGIYQLINIEQGYVSGQSLLPRGAVILSTGLFDSQLGSIGNIKIFLESNQVSTVTDPTLKDPNPRLVISEAATGIALSDNGTYFVVGTREVAPPKIAGCIPGTPPGNVCAPLSVNKQASVRVDDALIPQRQAELRYYFVDQSKFYQASSGSTAAGFPLGGFPGFTSNAQGPFRAPSLVFKSAVEISARINFVAISHDELSGRSDPCNCCQPEEHCFKVAVGTRAYSAIRDPGQCPGDAARSIPFSNPNIEVLMFTFDTVTGKFFLQDAKPVAVASFTGDFSLDNKFFSTSGRATFTQYGVSLWKITEQH